MSAEDDKKKRQEQATAGFAAEYGKGVPDGTFFMGEPEHFGTIPIRAELTVIPPDDPEEFKRRARAHYEKAVANKAANRWREKMGTEPPWPPDHKGHWWSGWPGAFCYRCGAEDAMENAFGLGWCDFQYDENGEPTDGPMVWDTPEHKALVEKMSHCPDDDPLPDPEGRIGFSIREEPGIGFANTRGLKALSLEPFHAESLPPGDTPVHGIEVVEDIRAFHIIEDEE